MNRSILRYALIGALGMLTAATASAETFSCNETDGRPGTRIVGGEQIAHADAPYQIKLIKFSDDGKGYSSCGGSLISRGHVLTAAHCVTDWQNVGSKPVAKDSFVVLYGGNNVPQMIKDKRGAKVARVDVHPRYNKDGVFTHDVAVLTLDRALNVRPDAIIQMASRRMETALMPDYTCARVTGYGRTDSGEPSDTMRSVDVFIRPQSDCREFARDLAARKGSKGGAQLIKPGMLCAGYKGGGRSSCKGDSGGPLVIREGPNRWVQVGIVSWGDVNCARIGAYGVYARVSEYADWIVEVASR